MQYSQKYVLVSFLESVEISSEFSMTDWPPHVTIADVFGVTFDTSLKEKLGNLLIAQASIRLTVGEDATLGTTEVVLIEQNDELQKIHEQIVDLLELSGAQFNTPEFTRIGFLPHSTIQKSGRLHKGDKIELHTVSLVDMFPGEDWRQRKVLDVFQLAR